MGSLTLLVLADPADPHLRLLERLPEETRIAAGRLPEAFESAAPETDVILSWFASRELLEQVWRMAPRVRWVHSASAGVENVLFPALVESPVPVTNSRGLFSRVLAEFAMAAVLYFAKDLRRMVLSQEAGLWNPFDIEEIHGRWLGIVGYGDIGRVVADRARAFGMRVAALRRRPELASGDPLVERVFSPQQRLEMLALADYVVVATPLTPETLGLIGEAELRAMKSSAVLINIGRGPVVDEAALARALKENRVRGAALDVFDTEPLPPGHPFYKLDNVLLSPHCADHFPGWMERAMELFLENFERFRLGEPLRNLVDKRQGY
ncbi:MAG: D-2-hydroxyacid dehydrogenase [Acidobacteriota bacterium]